MKQRVHRRGAKQRLGPQPVQTKGPVGEQIRRKHRTLAKGRQEQRIGPGGKADAQPPNRARAVCPAPKDRAKQGRQHLSHAGKGHQTNRRQGIEDKARDEERRSSALRRLGETTP